MMIYKDWLTYCKHILQLLQYLHFTPHVFYWVNIRGHCGPVHTLDSILRHKPLDSVCSMRWGIVLLVYDSLVLPTQRLDYRPQNLADVSTEIEYILTLAHNEIMIEDDSCLWWWLRHYIIKIDIFWLVMILFICLRAIQIAIKYH